MIAVVGLGFVGLTTALGFCEKGMRVRGYDVDKDKVNLLLNRNIPFHEPGLAQALERHLNQSFVLTDNIAVAVSDAKVIFYCVGTPSNEDGSSNLTYLQDAIRETLKSVKNNGFSILVIKSTVPPSTCTSKIQPLINDAGLIVGRDVGLAANPEFLREGCAWEDFMHPDRIIVGLNDARSEQTIRDIYEPFGAPIHIVSLNTAEFIKYLSNTFLSTLISFSNEMSMIAHSIGDIDISSAFKILHEDKRWCGSPAAMIHYAYPGCGFGGYCLPKDTRALCAEAKAHGCDSSLLDAVMKVNCRIKTFLVDYLSQRVNPQKKIGVLGLSFKPGSDDVRDSPAKDFIELLIGRNYKEIIAYDPVATNNFSNTYSFPVEYADSLHDVLAQTDTVVIVTAWPEFKQLSQRKDLCVFDFRYML